jgi:uncharacterized protein (TIGR03086 family)
MMFDLEPATDVMSRLVGGVGEEQLDAPTPCGQTTVAGLLNHVEGFCIAFTAAATKTSSERSGQAPSANASNLEPQWRALIPYRLTELARVWRLGDSWTGMTKAGGLDLPSDIAAHIVLNELVVHGWDIAAGTGQAFTADPGLLESAHAWVRSVVAENPNGSKGLFGPPVETPTDAPMVDQLIGLTGRDPLWPSRAR